MSDPFRSGRTAAKQMTREEAEAIAVAALGHIAGDGELLHRFVGVTGIEPGQIRRAAAEPGFLAGVLQFILAHEPTLLAFSEQSGISAATVASARRALPLGSDFEQ